MRSLDMYFGWIVDVVVGRDLTASATRLSMGFSFLFCALFVRVCVFFFFRVHFFFFPVDERKIRSILGSMKTIQQHDMSFFVLIYAVLVLQQYGNIPQRTARIHTSIM